MKVALEGGAVVVRHGPTVVLRADAAVRLADGRGLSVLDGGRAVADEGGGLTLERPGSSREPALRWRWAPVAGGGLEVRLALHNTTPQPLGVEQLLPLVAPTGYRDLPLDRLWVSQTGWQSWSRAHPLAPFAPNAESAPPPLRGPSLPHRLPGSQSVPWMALLAEAPPRASEALLLGFTAAHDLQGVVEVAPPTAADGGHHLRASAEVEGRPLAPGATLESEPLLLLHGPPAEVQQRYADALADRMQARPATVVPAGWCSWYQLFTGVTEADLLRNVNVLAAERATLPLDVIQLDDGYQREVGDWLDVRDTFPSGMAAVARAIRERGFMPGVWLAPFLLSARSRTWAAHPDWVVRGEDGAPLVAIENWDAPNYALDTTHPAALAWLEDVIRTACEDWGFDYLKLDFLYAAALRGRRHDPSATGVQAYRRGLEMVRRVAGPTRFLLGCGAPLAPSVGLVDAMRIGSDVAPYWRSDSGVGPATENALRATLARGWQHRRWWLNDPDCVLVREEESELTPHEVRAWASVVALSGGMVMLGDDVSRLDGEPRRLLGRLLPPLGLAASTNIGGATGLTPDRLRLDITRPGSAWSVVALANWSDDPRAVRFAPAEWGLSGAVHLLDLWSGTYLGLCDATLDLGILPPHGLRLLSVRHLVDRPHVAGSDGHLLGAAADLAEEAWDEEGAILRVTLAAPRAHAGTLSVWVPAGLHLAAADVDVEPGPSTRRGQVWRVPFGAREAPLTVALAFEPAPGAGA